MCRCSVQAPAGSSAGAGAVWRRLVLSIANRTAHYSVDGGATMYALPLPPTVATGAGFAAIASSFTEVEFDDFEIGPSSAGQLVSRCLAPPAVGQRLVVVGCGEPAAEAGSRWQMSAGAVAGAGANGTGSGPISLRSDPSLCLAPAATSSSGKHNSESGGVVGGGVGGGGGQQLAWSSSPTGHGAGVVISSDRQWAQWKTAPKHPGCDAVALGAASAVSAPKAHGIAPSMSLASPASSPQSA